MLFCFLNPKNLLMALFYTYNLGEDTKIVTLLESSLRSLSRRSDDNRARVTPYKRVLDTDGSRHQVKLELPKHLLFRDEQKRMK
jgi:hypothetical protein